MDKGKDLMQPSNIGENGSSFNVVTFKDINWIDHTAHIMDLGESRVRVESNRPVDPGFIWFNDRVRGHKGGIIIWCGKYEERYRAVIRLVPLTRDEERLVQERTVRSSSHRPHRSPEEIIATLTQSIRRNSS